MPLFVILIDSQCVNKKDSNKNVIHFYKHVLFYFGKPVLEAFAFILMFMYRLLLGQYGIMVSL